MQDERLPMFSGMIALSFARSRRGRRRGWKLTTASPSPSHDACTGPTSSSLVRTAAYWLLPKSMPGKIDRAACSIGVGAASMSAVARPAATTVTNEGLTGSA